MTSPYAFAAIHVAMQRLERRVMPQRAERRLMSPPHIKDWVIDVVKFCAIECRLQGSGEPSVWRMVAAWKYALEQVDQYDVKSMAQELPIASYTVLRPPDVYDVLAIGRIIDPRNEDGYRRVPVRVGSDLVRVHHDDIPREIELLVGAQANLAPAEFFREFEEIHPFIDGNGRAGQLLFNWLSDTLDRPSWAPNFWRDPRRTEGVGA